MTDFVWDARALAYFVAGAMMLFLGLAVALYERFSAISRRLLFLGVVVALWVVALGMAILAATPEGPELWLRAAYVVGPFVAPAVFWVGTGLAQEAWPRTQRALWAAAGAFALISLAGPWLVRGLQVATREYRIDGLGWLGWLYLIWELGVLTAALVEVFRSRPWAQVREERHGARLVAAAAVVGWLGVIDYWTPSDPWRAGLVTPFALITAVVFAGFVEVRYRVFSLVHTLGTRGVLRAMSDAVLVCDSTGRLRSANRAAEDLFARPESSLLGCSVSEFLHESDPGDSSGGWAPPLDRPVRDRSLVAVRRRQPARVEVSVSTEPLRAGSRILGSVVVARDIRERLETERAVQASERRYRSLFWHNPGAAYEIDAEGRFLELNPPAQRLLGGEVQDWIGRRFIEIVEPSERERAERLFSKVLGGEPQQYELTVLGQGGEPRVIQGMSIPVVEDGSVSTIFGVALDVTEERRMHRQLEVQRHYYAELFDSSPEAIVLVGSDGRIRRVNSEFTRLFGYTAEEAVGEPLDDLVVPEGLRGEAHELNSAALDGRLAFAEMRRRRKEGGEVEVSVLAREVRIPGEPPQMYGIYRDITDRRQAERKLREREEELRHAQKLEAVGKLAGGVAHDFNNLLTVINGHTRFVLEEMGEDDALRPDLEEIERAGVRAATLTQQLLAFSRRQMLRPQVLDLNRVVRDMNRMLGRLIAEHIRLETRLEAAPASVLADRGQLEQVIMNLVVNALDAMPAGGVLTISTDVTRLERGAVGGEHWDVEPGDYVRLLVEDTGSGMSEETLARAFDPFFTTKDRGKGTGLGLATVFGIVKQSGGHVSAESEPGDGSGFHVYLPLATSAETEEGGPDAATDPEREAPGAHTVLVVEDEDAVRKLVARVLQRRGYQVMLATDGADALRVVGQHGSGIDLVLSDLVMPEMGGRELADHMRESWPEIPILFMSGYEEDLAASGGGGLSASFLPKPFTPRALTEKVAEALSL